MNRTKSGRPAQDQDMDFSQALDQVLQHCEALRLAAESAMRHGDEHLQYCVRLRGKLEKAVEGHKKTIAALNVEVEAVRKLVADQQAAVQEKADLALYARESYEKVLANKKNLVDEAINLGLKEEDIPSEPLPPKTYVSPADRAPPPPKMESAPSVGSQSAASPQANNRQPASFGLDEGLTGMSGVASDGQRQAQMGNAASSGPGATARPSLVIPAGFDDDDDDDDLFGGGLGGLGGLGDNGMMGVGSLGKQTPPQQSMAQTPSQIGGGMFGGLDMDDDFDDDFASLGF